MIIVNAIIVEKENILTVKRNRDPYKGMYGLPGGHVEPSEAKESTLIRELKEETNSEIEIQTCLGMVKNNNNDVHIYKVKVKLPTAASCGVNPKQEFSFLCQYSLLSSSH